MTPSELKENRISYLTGILDKYMKSEPRITLSDLAKILAFEIDDELEDFLKKYHYQIKKEK
jgi:hypothetical protein